MSILDDKTIQHMDDAVTIVGLKEEIHKQSVEIMVLKNAMWKLIEGARDWIHQHGDEYLYSPPMGVTQLSSNMQFDIYTHLLKIAKGEIDNFIPAYMLSTEDEITRWVKEQFDINMKGTE